jgi:hypothetical protein
VRRVCSAFQRRDAAAIIKSLPYYQYNSGLRFGLFGDGEGQTGNPSLMRRWLSGSAVRCTYVTPDRHGHGTLLAGIWKQPAPWALMTIDTFNGRWKINDFTFGQQARLFAAMHTTRPILPFKG